MQPSHSTPGTFTGMLTANMLATQQQQLAASGASYPGDKRAAGSALPVAAPAKGKRPRAMLANTVNATGLNAAAQGQEDKRRRKVVPPG